MKLRTLRILFSAACGFGCVVLLGLWFRSYYTSDLVKGSLPGIPAMMLMSHRGSIFIDGFNAPGTYSPHWHWYRSYQSAPIPLGGNALGFSLMHSRSGPKILFPYWFVAVVPACIGMAPWLRRRYSLRAALTVMTIVAMLLGLAVYAARK